MCWLWWAKASYLAALFKTPIDGRPLCQDEDISLSMRCKLCHNATVGFKRTLKGRMVLLKVASHITSHLCEEMDMKLLWLCKILFHLVSCGHHIWLWDSAYEKGFFCCTNPECHSSPAFSVKRSMPSKYHEPHMNGIFPVNAHNLIHIIESREVPSCTQNSLDKKHMVRFYSLEKFPLVPAASFCAWIWSVLPHRHYLVFHRLLLSSILI